MKKQKELSTFEKILKEEGALQMFNRELKENRGYENIQELVDKCGVDTTIDTIRISHCFYWEATPQGHDFWENLHEKLIIARRSK